MHFMQELVKGLRRTIMEEEGREDTDPRDLIHTIFE
jgi:hypothetical protein